MTRLPFVPVRNANGPALQTGVKLQGQQGHAALPRQFPVPGPAPKAFRAQWRKSCCVSLLLKMDKKGRTQGAWCLAWSQAVEQATSATPCTPHSAAIVITSLFVFPVLLLPTFGAFFPLTAAVCMGSGYLPQKGQLHQELNL